MRGSDIRPDALLDEQARCLADDAQWLLERRAEFVEVDCPACAEVDKRFAIEKRGFSYVECVSCGTGYLPLRPTPDVLREYYRRSKNYAYWAERIFPASEDARRTAMFEPRARRLLDKLPGDHGLSLLEVGSGYGTFLEVARSTGRFSRVDGLELTPSLAAACRARGFDVFETSVEDLSLERRYDAVVAFEVIEHLFDPLAFLWMVAAKLEPGGVLYMTCPNWLGFELQELGALSTTIDHEHLNYFHPSSMRALLDKAGFDVLELSTPGALDAGAVRGAVLAGDHFVSKSSGRTRGASSLLQRVLVDDWVELGGKFQAFLADCGMSSHMSVVAKLRLERRTQ